MINDLMEETACFDNSFVESRDFSRERSGQEGGVCVCMYLKLRSVGKG